MLPLPQYYSMYGFRICRFSHWPVGKRGGGNTGKDPAVLIQLTVGVEMNIHDLVGCQTLVMRPVTARSRGQKDCVLESEDSPRALDAP